jgi:hypothetical protein
MILNMNRGRLLAIGAAFDRRIPWNSGEGLPWVPATE